MRKVCCLFLLLISRFVVVAQTTILPEQGQTITHSVKIQPGIYTFTPAHDSIAWLEINGQDITVDLSGVTLTGSTQLHTPNTFKGIAIRIRKGSSRIHIKQATINGFKVAILADSVNGLVIEQCQLSYNYRQELKSNLNREDVSDWLSFHHNEQDEWLRYGAAIYLRNCRQARILNNTATDGQCALMLTNCDSATVAYNNFSFNSGIGIGLYRSSYNQIYQNRLDWNVRGYSHGKYRRGQDSAGILVFEQSNENVFAYNSATHSGDGFFLWAGQYTMDTGLGGCNDNLIYGNDFSYAPTNGAELTFSRNIVMKNQIRDCDHGIWAGYSFESDFTDNDFAFNRIGIAIEHGQSNNIALNRFLYDKTGIKLWSRASQPTDWGYAKTRNTESRRYWIAANQFTAVETVYDIMGTDTVAFSGNIKMAQTTGLKLGERTNDIDSSREEDPLNIDYAPDERLKQIPVQKKPDPLFPKGREQIRITQWGPYNFQYPLLWLQSVDSTGLLHFEVLGKTGHWQVKSMAGYELVSKGADSFPSVLIVRPLSNQINKSIRLIYTGPAYTNQFGEGGQSGDLFGYDSFEPGNRWDVYWYRWDENHAPLLQPEAFNRLIADTSAAVFKLHNSPALDYTWWGAIGKQLPADSFATVATTTLDIPAGKYRLGITADDMVKVLVDGKLVIDAWTGTAGLDENTYHEQVLDLSGGKHQITLIHTENTGLATLMWYFRPLREPNGK